MPNPRLCSVEGCGKRVFGHGWCQRHYTKVRKYSDPLAGRTYTERGEPLAWIVRHKDHEGTDCLFWPYAKTRSGYGDLWVGKRHVRAHRYMCELTYGPPPSKLHEACHSCGNGHLGCANPNHLRWGTSKENSEDAHTHGTTSRGEKRYNAKLTREEVLRIRSLLTTEMSQHQIGQAFGVCQQTIGDIKRGKLWGWLP